LSPSTTLFRRLIQFKEVKFKLLLFSLARDWRSYFCIAEGVSLHSFNYKKVRATWIPFASKSFSMGARGTFHTHSPNSIKIAERRGGIKIPDSPFLNPRFSCTVEITWSLFWSEAWFSNESRTITCQQYALLGTL
jgi:hypothetical protein